MAGETSHRMAGAGQRRGISLRLQHRRGLRQGRQGGRGRARESGGEDEALLMPSPRIPIPFVAMLAVAVVALAAGCRALDADTDRDKAKNAGGNGSMYREPYGARNR